jgi:hypothetical protein
MKTNFPTSLSFSVECQSAPWDCAVPPSRSASDEIERVFATCRIASFAHVSCELAQYQLSPAWDQTSLKLEIHARSLVGVDSLHQLKLRDGDTATSQDGDIHFHATACAPCCCVFDDVSTSFVRVTPSRADSLRFHFHLNSAQNRFLIFYERATLVERVLVICRGGRRKNEIFIEFA